MKETRKEGSSAAIRKAVRVVAGLLVVAVGLIMAIPAVPGPGIAVIIVGLIILSPHFAWARRLLEWLRARVERLRKRVLSTEPRRSGDGPSETGR